jgi:hypothetical protein
MVLCVFFVVVVFWWDWGLNSGKGTCLTQLFFELMAFLIFFIITHIKKYILGAGRV